MTDGLTSPMSGEIWLVGFDPSVGADEEDEARRRGQ